MRSPDFEPAGRRRPSPGAGLSAVVLAFAGGALAQDDRMAPIPIPAQPNAIKLDTGTSPADAPPMFVALAADDPFFAHSGVGLIDRWRSAGRPVEFHLYEQGGHGFGMYQKTTTSTGWFDAYLRWIEMHGMLKPKP